MSNEMSAQMVTPRYDEHGMRLRTGFNPNVFMELDAGDAGDSGSGGTDAGSDDTGAGDTGDSGDAGSAPDLFNDDKVETFPREYVTKLREESARYRTQAKEVGAKFEGIDEQVLDGLLGVAKAYESDPDAARQVLETLMEGLTPAQQKELQEGLEKDETPKGMTPEEVEAFLEEREAAKEAEKAQEAQLADLQKTITDLGYDLDEANPNPDTALLFFFAGQQEGDGPKDFAKADEAVKAVKQQVIDEYKETVRLNNSRFGRVTTGATPAGADGGNKKLGRISEGGPAAAMASFLDTLDD